MEEGFSKDPHLLKSTFRRRQETTFIHVLRPAYRMNRSDYERILDLEPGLKGSPFGASGFQTDSPTEPQPHLGKYGEDLDPLFGPQDRHSSASHKALAFDDPSRGSSGECNGSPSWCQTSFRLDTPSPAGASPFPSRSSGNAWPASYLPPSPNEKGRPRRDDKKQRKSCEYCRFRKKRCSGHGTCVRCSRLGIGCVYMPDLIAKRMADCLQENTHPPLGSRFSYPTVSMSTTGSCVGKRDPGYSCVTSILDSVLPEIPPQPTGRGRKIVPYIPTNRHKRLRPRKAPTQPLTPDPDGDTPLSDCPDSVVAGLGSEYVEHVIHLADGVLGMAIRDMDSWYSGPRWASFDHNVVSVPEYSDASKPQEDFAYTPTIQKPESTEDDARVPEHEASPLDIHPVIVKTSHIPGFDTFPFTETGTSAESFESLCAPSKSFSSIVSPSSGSTLSTTTVGDSTEPWTVDEWLAWYAFYPVPVIRVIYPYAPGHRRFFREWNKSSTTPILLSRQTSRSDDFSRAGSSQQQDRFHCNAL